MEIPDDDAIKQIRANTEQIKQDTTDQLMANPRDPRNKKLVTDTRRKIQLGQENEDRLIRNKAEHNTLIAAQTKDEFSGISPWRYSKPKQAERDYGLARGADPFGTAPDLNLEPFVANVPKHINRQTTVNTALSGMQNREIFSKADLESVKNTRVETIDGEKVLVSVTGKGKSTGRVARGIEEVFNQPGFSEDVRAQAEYEFEQVGQSGQTEDVEARELEILNGLRQAAIDKFAGTELSQSIKRIPTGKGLTFNFGGAQSERFNYVRDIVEEKRTSAQQETVGFDFEGKKVKGEPTIDAAAFPGTEGSTITQTGRDDIVIATRKGKNPRINISDGKPGSDKTIGADTKRFLRDDKGEWHLLVEVPAGQNMWLPAGTEIVKDGFKETTEDEGYERSQKPIQITRPWSEVKEEYAAEYDGDTVEKLLAGWGELSERTGEIAPTKTGGEPAPAPEAPTEGRKKFNAATGKLE